MNNTRPNPDELLARVQAEEAQRARGKLKIFFGACAGVGKTYAMLEAAQSRRAEQLDVVVGYVETHGRAETEALLDDLKILPRRPIDYRGVTLTEFDLDAALARHPALILVDELAHTNASGCRHAKRWQDVVELLEAGIDVYTTVNVQHLESLNDVVAQITGVIVRETVPDAILEQADEVELIDLPTDDLLQRLREGKVYVPQQAEKASHNFFRKGNLIALRELALRRTADRVDAQMELYRRDKAISSSWPAAERILVCISSSPLSARLVRAARRMAAGLHAEWLAVYVETSASLNAPETDRNRVIQTLRLAEQLGGKTVTLSGQKVSEELLNYARSRNVSKIIIGKPLRPRWREILFGSVVDELIRGSGEIDVYVISGEESASPLVLPGVLTRTSHWPAYFQGAGIIAICTALAWMMYPYFAEANLIMVYLVGVVIVAMRYGRGPSIMAAILSVAAFDFFYIPPHLTFAVSDVQYVVTFGVMLTVGLVISALTNRMRQQSLAARQRERRTAALYALSREFASKRGLDNLLQVAAQHIAEIFDSQVALLLPDPPKRLAVKAVKPATFTLEDAAEQSVAQWVFEHGQMAGRGTDTLPGSQALYLPLTGTGGPIGVLAVQSPPERQFSPEQLHLLETFANQTALAIERAKLADEAQHASVQAETERLRNTLLSSVSHDLRTPLAAITGAASTLLDDAGNLSPQTRLDLAQTIYEEAEWLNRLVGNLLEITRLEAGVQLNREWQLLEEVIGAALNRLESRLRDYPVNIYLPEDLPLLLMDSVLITQVFINLLDNARKFSPPGQPIDISARLTENRAVVEVADRGAGLPPGDESRIFNKFYGAQRSASSMSVGLGLAICQGIIEAHGGGIWAENRPGGGAIFSFTLPATEPPPVIEPVET